MDVSGFPRDLATATAKKVSRAVADVIDCRPNTIEEAQNVLQRLAVTVQLYECEVSDEISAEARSGDLNNPVPTKPEWEKLRPSRVRRKKLREVTSFIRYRSMEFVRAAERMVLGLSGHEKNVPLSLHLERFIPALKGLLARLWWLTNLNRGVSDISTLTPVRVYHAD